MERYKAANKAVKKEIRNTKVKKGGPTRNVRLLRIIFIKTQSKPTRL